MWSALCGEGRSNPTLQALPPGYIARQRAASCEAVVATVSTPVPDLGELARLETELTALSNRWLALRDANAEAEYRVGANLARRNSGVRITYESCAHDVRALRDRLAGSLSFLLAQSAAVERVRAIHQPRVATVYASVHHDADHDSEDGRCTDACFEPWTLCNGCGSAWPCSTHRALDGASDATD